MMNHSAIQVTADIYGKHARGILDRLHDGNSTLNDLDGPCKDPWHDDSEE
jgi:hypothetical protein